MAEREDGDRSAAETERAARTASTRTRNRAAWWRSEYRQRDPVRPHPKCDEGNRATERETRRDGARWSLNAEGGGHRGRYRGRRQRLDRHSGVQSPRRRAGEARQNG